MSNTVRSSETRHGSGSRASLFPGSVVPLSRLQPCIQKTRFIRVGEELHQRYTWTRHIDDFQNEARGFATRYPRLLPWLA